MLNMCSGTITAVRGGCHLQPTSIYPHNYEYISAVERHTQFFTHKWTNKKYICIYIKKDQQKELSCWCMQSWAPRRMLSHAHPMLVSMCCPVASYLVELRSKRMPGGEHLQHPASSTYMLSHVRPILACKRPPTPKKKCLAKKNSKRTKHAHVYRRTKMNSK